MNEETKIQRRILIALSQNGCTAFRNECGQFWSGKKIHSDGSSVTLANGRPIPCGLAVGSSDIIFIHRESGRFGACEVKTAKGRATKEQIAFINHINDSGGIAFIARSPEEAVELLSKATNKD